MWELVISGERGAQAIFPHTPVSMPWSTSVQPEPPRSGPGSSQKMRNITRGLISFG
jgi:hypothetical protein